MSNEIGFLVLNPRSKFYRYYWITVDFDKLEGENSVVTTRRNILLSIRDVVNGNPAKGLTIGAQNDLFLENNACCRRCSRVLMKSH